MSERRDELDALRAAWRELRAPDDLTRSTGTDDETRACVDWMASAWSSLDPPPMALPPALSSHRRGRHPNTLRRSVLRLTLPFAAAACALILFQVQRSDPNPEPGASLEIARAEPIRPVVHADGSVETRFGSVRLILLPDDPDETPSPRTSPTNPPPVEPPMENSR